MSIPGYPPVLSTPGPDIAYSPLVPIVGLKQSGVAPQGMQNQPASVASNPASLTVGAGFQIGAAGSGTASSGPANVIMDGSGIFVVTATQQGPFISAKS